jgi:uncharacterized protein (TIGR02284 family)
MITEEIIRHLNDLIEVSLDGEHGYTAAATHVSDPHFQTEFAEEAKHRAGFVKELRAQVERLGGEPVASGTLQASVHRGWLDLKSAVSGGAPEGIIDACETGEDFALAAYERVVNLDISGEPRTVVEKQMNQIRQAHRRLLNLKSRAGHPPA